MASPGGSGVGLGRLSRSADLGGQAREVEKKAARPWGGRGALWQRSRPPAANGTTEGTLTMDLMANATEKPNGTYGGSSTTPGPALVDARKLLPSPENALLYRERKPDDLDYRRLVQSIRQIGVQSPLLVSRDNYIVSGHQRQSGATEAEHFLVPVIYLNISRADHT